VPNLALACMVVVYNNIIYCQLLFSFSHIVFATVVLSFKSPCVICKFLKSEVNQSAVVGWLEIQESVTITTMGSKGASDMGAYGFKLRSY
jgi:hypothetical protein